MATRRAFILAIVGIGAMCLIAGTPERFQWLTAGATSYLFAYVYAQLTRPKS